MKYSELTEEGLIRFAIKKGRVRPPSSSDESELMPSFADALPKANSDDLQEALDYFIHNPDTKYSFRRYRMKAIADELMRRARG